MVQINDTITSQINKVAAKKSRKLKLKIKGVRKKKLVIDEGIEVRQKENKL